MAATAPTDHRELLQRALVTLDELEARLHESERRRHEPIAIIGMGLRLPGGVHDPDAYWELLVSGRDAITEIPADRWDVEAMFDPDPDAPGKSYSRWGGFIDGVDQFDPGFFGISPREALSMDPQHRLLLEVAWEALEHAALAPSALAGTRTGVFVGISATDFADVTLRGGIMDDADAYFATGVAHSIAAGRLAYLLDLQGPTAAIDTACSSSLVATHMACQALRAGECDHALAGGVNLMLSPDAHIASSRARMMSFEGRCKTFDAGADGYVRGEGAGLLVLKRLADAVEDGDRILAVIRGTSVNQDGRSNGLTAPNAAAQEAVIRGALADARLEPGAVSFVECHGTGTTLGDPIEVRALQAVYGAGRSPERPLLVQSVKTNIGHLEAAAGVAGLCKLVLALGRGELPAHLHLARPNPYIPWHDIAVAPLSGPAPWEQPDGARRVGGVSSFGFSGTNAHLVLEAPPPEVTAQEGAPSRPHRVYPVSAPTGDALDELAVAHAAVLQRTDVPFAAAAATATTGRAHLTERLAVVAADASEAATQLADAAAGGRSADAARATARRGDDGVVMLFTGQGSQAAGMGRQLYATEPAFRASLDLSATVLHARRFDLLAVMFGDGPGPDGLTIDDTRCAQPALFAYEVAMAALWRSWGVEPAAVIGHSIGELAAAHVAGVLSLADALAVVDSRGRLMQQLPRTGGMAAVFADEVLVREAVAPWADALSIAALNGPRRVVISGHLDALDAVVAKLEADSVRVTRLQVSHAFHSPLMDPMLDEFEHVVASATLAEPVIELISNRTAQVAAPGLLTTPRYWREHVREAVRFGESVRHAVDLGYRSFLEVGPGPTLAGLAASCEPPSDALLVASVQRPADEARDVQRAVAKLHVHGVEIDWRAYEGPVRQRPVSLPTAAFRRDRFRHPRAQPDHGPARTAAGSSCTSLLGDELRSPKIAGQIFERRLSTTEPDWLTDHVIYGATLVPATAYLELMRRAGQAAGGTADVVDVRIDAPLVLDERYPTTVQTIVDDDGAVVGVYSDQGTGGWQRHATGRLAVPEDDDPSGGHPSSLSSLGGSTELEDVWSRADQTVEGGDYYAALLRLGATYGPRFRGIERATRRDGEAVAALRAPAPEREPDALHPGLADSCLQVLGLAMPGGGDLANVGGDAYLPVAVERWHVPAGAPDRCREGGLLTAVARVRPTDVEGAGPQPRRGEVIGDVVLFDADGVLVASLEGVHLVPAPRTALRRSHGAPAEWTYLPQWVASPLPPTEGRRLEGCQLVVGAGALAVAVADAIVLSGGTVEVVDPARRPGADVGPAVGAALEDGVDGVVVALAGSAEGRPVAWEVADTIAHVVRLRPDVPITVVTVGAMAVVPGDGCQGSLQASAWGVGRVALAEHPALALRLLDLPSPEVVEPVVAELLADDRDEPQVAWRDGERYALRLARSGDHVGLTIPDGPYQLVLEEAGRLDGLRLAEQADLAPGPGELLIDVRATGLNFRDVLNALGTYAGGDARLGGECAGTVLGVGDGVERVRVGDRVMAVAGAGFASRCVVPEAMAAHPPAGWSDAEAASLPIAFLTASYGLERLGGMKAGDRVLIHAAAGGVGMAAVQLALAAGAEIYATAGSPAKRAALAELGVQHVYSSRSLEFREQIRHDTGGEGVDLVLNSLSGDSIAASLDVLAPGGRFLEIGMAGIWDHEQVRAARPDAEYHVIYLGDVCVQQPELIAELLDDLVRRFDRGALRRPPITAFDIRQAVAAFRYMAQARHIGKVVVTASVGWGLESAGGTWIITGGLGGLGLTVAAELADAGADRLVLCSRSADGEEHEAAVATLRATGVDVRVVALDVADGEAVAAMVSAVTADGMRLTGVVHAAGVVDDGLLVDLTSERFETVARAKVTGAAHLAAATDPHHPDHFVLFSAGAGLLGSPGQANYAAANAVLDAVAWRRRAAGRPAQAIDWGPWKDAGMASRVGAAVQRRWESQGIVAFDPDDGRRALRSVLAAGETQAAVVDLRWPTLLQHFSKHTVPSIFRHLVPSEQRRRAPADAPAAELVPALQELPVDRRRDRLTSEVRSQLLQVLGLEANHPIDPRRGLTDLGMDSLMAVELSNRLSSLVDRPLPSTLALEQPTLEALSRHLEEELADRVAFVAATAPPPVEDELSDLSVDELTAALVRELDDAGY